MSANHIPGFNQRDITVPLECEASRLYATAQGVHAALEAQVQAVRDALGDGAVVLARAQMERAAREALAAHWERAEYIDPGGLCGFEGEADATAENGTIRVTCPRCDQQHEIPQD